MRAKLDEYVRMAFNDILDTAAHLVLRTRVRVDLIDGRHSYDVPDGFIPGKFDAVLIEDVNGVETPVAAGVREYERSLWKMDDSGEQDRRGLPARYEVINQNLDIYPAPDTETYKYLVFEGTRTPPEPVANDDKIELHKEALIRLATFYGKSDLGQGDAGAVFARYQSLVDKVRARETEGEVIRLGGHFSRKFAYSTHRETSGGPDYSRYPYWRPGFNTWR